MTFFQTTLFLALLCVFALQANATTVKQVVRQDADGGAPDGGAPDGGAPDGGAPADEGAAAPASDGGSGSGFPDIFGIQSALMSAVGKQAPTCYASQMKYVCVPCGSPLLPFPCVTFCGIDRLPCPQFGEATCSNERYCFYEAFGVSFINPSCYCVELPAPPTTQG